MVTIAVDAMGGDNAPHIEVEGALAAARDYGVRIVLVGREDVVRPELDKHSGWKQLPIELVHASEVITMDDAERVRFDIVAFSRPATRLAQTSGPIGRAVQTKITDRYIEAMVAYTRPDTRPER